MKSTCKLIILTLLIFSFSVTKAQKHKSGDIIGNWVTEENRSIIKIFEKDNKYYGKIIWLKEPNDEDGNPKTDKENSDEKLRNRGLKNMVIMYNFEFDGEKWDDGKIYDPKNGNTYSGTIKLRTNDIIDIRGYVGISLLGRTSSWIRYKPKKDN